MTVLDRDHLIDDPLDRIETLERRIEDLERIALLGASDQTRVEFDGDIWIPRGHDLFIDEQSAAFGRLIGMYQNLPMLVGFWPMSGVNIGGNVFDFSINARTLTYNGNPTFNYDGFVPYVDLDGTGDFLSRTDEAGLDITGTESIVASAIRGLTIGVWTYVDTSGGSERGLAGKYNTAGNQRSYLIYKNTSDNYIFIVSSNGTATVTVSGGAYTQSQWQLVIGRFGPSNEMIIDVDGTKTVNSTSIPASIHSGTANFQMGSHSGASSLLDGRLSMGFLCACMLDDDTISALFQQGRSLFGV